VENVEGVNDGAGKKENEILKGKRKEKRKKKV